MYHVVKIETVVANARHAIHARKCPGLFILCMQDTNSGHRYQENKGIDQEARRAQNSFSGTPAERTPSSSSFHDAQSTLTLWGFGPSVSLSHHSSAALFAVTVTTRPLRRGSRKRSDTVVTSRPGAQNATGRTETKQGQGKESGLSSKTLEGGLFGRCRPVRVHFDGGLVELLEQ